jgi:undecaprenyl diphosphate synthase
MINNNKEEMDISSLNLADLNIPRHLAVTMDGNGRWAKSKNKKRTEGHKAGTDALRRLVELAINYKIKYLTVFSFSSENWSRPKEEVNFILRLMRHYVKSDLKKLAKNNVKIRIIGEREGLDQTILSLIELAQSRTKDNTGLELIIAFNYGGKAEIANALKKIAQKVEKGLIKIDEISEDIISNELYLSDVPDPDIVLRTSGEHRFSNFLLWQSAYSELIFIDENWPDFNEDIFIKMLKNYSIRERRFGGIEAIKS